MSHGVLAAAGQEVLRHELVDLRRMGRFFYSGYCTAMLSPVNVRRERMAHEQQGESCWRGFRGGEGGGGGGDWLLSRIYRGVAAREVGM